MPKTIATHFQSITLVPVIVTIPDNVETMIDPETKEVKIVSNDPLHTGIGNFGRRVYNLQEAAARGLVEARRDVPGL